MMRMLPLLLCALAACADAPLPTAPAPVLVPVVAPEAPAPAPAAPVVPVPAPAPVPAPPPLPVPSPPPDPSWSATVTSAHWYGAAALPASFTITFERPLPSGAVSVAIGPSLRLPLLLDGDDWIAKDHEATFSVIGGAWTFNGVAGQAMGTLAR